MPRKANKKKPMLVIGFALVVLGAITTAGVLHAKTHPEAYALQADDVTFSQNAMAVTSGYVAPMMPFSK